MDVREGTVALTCSGVLVSGWQAQVGSLNSEHGCMCVSQCVCVCVCVCVGNCGCPTHWQADLRVSGGPRVPLGLLVARGFLLETCAGVLALHRGSSPAATLLSVLWQWSPRGSESRLRHRGVKSQYVRRLHWELCVRHRQWQHPCRGSSRCQVAAQGS